MSSEIGKYNLDKDKKVLGNKWFTTYGGWFSDEENIRLFIDAVRPLLPNGKLDILYVASASGLLGERLIENIGKGNLTLVDMSDEHLNENKNPKTKKIKVDLLDMDLGKKFDLILMRSSLDYFPSIQMQIDVLRIIKKHLKDDGLFVNQPAYITDIKDRDIISNAYNITGKIGKRFFQSSDIDSIYLEAGFEAPKNIGESKTMRITEQDHVNRYDLNRGDVKLIQETIDDVKHNAFVTEQGYIMEFEFPIFVSKIREI